MNVYIVDLYQKAKMLVCVSGTSHSSLYFVLDACQVSGMNVYRFGACFPARPCQSNP